jgi:putative protease
MEVFVHGALCVAYSGQCLTSESLGGRSANRGVCAQACRLPYELISDGQLVPLGDRKYLLSPQDLAGLELLPDLVRSGVTSLKIEGRLKSPEYVANITRIYRQSLDKLASLPPGRADLLVRQGQGESGKGGRAELPLRQGVAQPSSAASSSTVSVRVLPTVDYATQSSHYEMEMAFSRGLYTGWFRGINNQELVHARFGKKRGVYLGEIAGVEARFVRLELQGPLKAGDGVVFDAGHPEDAEEGGRVYSVERRGPETWLGFGPGINLSRLHRGDKLWKTSDPELDRRLRQTFDGDNPKFQRPLSLEVSGAAGQPLEVTARDGENNEVRVKSVMPLSQADKQPLTPERLRAQLGRLGGTPFQLGELICNRLEGSVLLPVSELNRLRRLIVDELLAIRSRPQRWTLNSSGRDIALRCHRPRGADGPESRVTIDQSREAGPANRFNAPAAPAQAAPNNPDIHQSINPNLIVLVRSLPQLEAAMECDVRTIYCEFEDPKKYRDAVRLFRLAAPKPGEDGPANRFNSSAAPQTNPVIAGGLPKYGVRSNAFPSPLPSDGRGEGQGEVRAGEGGISAHTNPSIHKSTNPSEIFIAPPRIFKMGEDWILKQVRSCEADGYLVRNYDHLRFFAGNGDRCIGDYSLNVANSLAADYFKNRFRLERVTASYDLNFDQLEALLASGAPPEWFEITIHQHIPMFHMEHCVFCAFLSSGTDYTNCGRPCDKHDVQLRDRVGAAHPLKADAGCRNTVFNALAQTGADYVPKMLALGARHFRLEFLNETPAQITQTIGRYQRLLRGEITGQDLWRELKLLNQLGVTRGTMRSEPG